MDDSVDPTVIQFEKGYRILERAMTIKRFTRPSFNKMINKLREIANDSIKIFNEGWN